MQTTDFDSEWDTPRPPMGFIGITVWIGLIIGFGFAAKAIFF